MDLWAYSNIENLDELAKKTALIVRDFVVIGL